MLSLIELIKMEKQTFFLVAGIFFSLASLLHLLRILYSLSVIVGTVEIPLWFSYIAVILLGFLSFWAFKFSKR